MIMSANGVIGCEEVLARLWEFLDGELTPENEEAVRRHLALCGQCYPQYDFQRAYLAYVRKLREREHAPATFRRRLFEKLLEQERLERHGS